MQSRNIRPTGRPGQAGGFPAPRSRRDDDYDDRRGGGRDDQYSSSRSGGGRAAPSDNYSSRQGPSASAGRSRGPVNSTSSESSTGSSLLDRMKVRSETSSRTSLDDDDGYRNGRSAKKPASQSLRRPSRSRTRRERDYEEEEEEPPPVPDPNSAGNSLWSRLTAAAGNITVSVGKAWDGGNDSGEETPVGGESRLTKAMKEYYLSRASRPSDLPPWLFEEHERGGGSSRATRSNTNRRGRRDEEEDGYEDDRRDGGRQKDDSQNQSNRGFRDIYDRNKGASSNNAAGASSSSSRSRLAAPSAAASSRDGGLSDSGSGPAKSTSRLAAIREAKKAARDGSVRRARSDVGDDDDYRNGYEEPAPARRPPPRAGLPSGPGGRARRV